MPTRFWKITNHISTDTNLVLIDAYTNQVLPSVFFYEQTLQVLPLSSSLPYIKPTLSDVFTLPDPHMDTDGNTMPYTFIIAKAETLAPIAAVVHPADWTPTELEVTDDMSAYIKKVYDFIKNITAFSTSNLAENFVTAVNDGSQSAIQAFFDGTADYKDVKIEDVHLVQTYYKALPYGWTGGSNAKFYLYSKDYKNNSDTDEPIAELNISNDWTSPAAVIPDSAKFKMELYTWDNKKTIQLEFKNGAFWDSTSTDTPKVVLAGSFIMPSQLTQETSRHDIEAYLLGNMYGFDVFGLSARAPHDQDDDGGFLDVFAVHNFKQGLDVAMYFISIGMGIGFLVGCYYAVKYIKNKFNSDDALETQKKAEEVKEFMRQSNVALATKVSPRVRIIEPADIPAGQEEARQQALQERYRLARTNLQDMVNGQSTSLGSLGNIHIDENLQEVFDGLEVIQDVLDGELDTMAPLIEGGVMGRLQGYNNTINQRRVAVERQLTLDQKKAYTEAQASYDLARGIETLNEEQIRDIANGEDFVEIEAEHPAAPVLDAL